MGIPSIEEAILKSIDIIVSKKIEQAGYNKTIQATVMNCIDATTGQYRVQYQDSFFNVYSESTDVSYTSGANVYILIPNGDMSSKKIIIGSIDDLGVDYINPIRLVDRYSEIGNNILIDDAEFGLCSYRPGVKVLYSKEAEASTNLILVDENAAEYYLKESNSFMIRAKIRNELALEQRLQGNFGIVYGLDFKDNTTEEEVTRYYILDVDRIKGNPYLLTEYTTQTVFFEIDGLNFLGINSISIFTDSFPRLDESKENDIFIKDLELIAVEKLSEDELDSYSLNLITNKGYIFTSRDTDEDVRPIKAQLRAKGQIVNTDIQDVEYYWFILNNGITAISPYFNVLGGQGWKCLNNYNIVSNAITDENEDVTAPAVYDFISGSSSFEVKKLNVLTNKVKYKCVAVYNGNVLSKLITMINLDATYEIHIESSSGTQFYFDNGDTVLTCKCLYDSTEIPSEDLSYAWSSVSSAGTFNSLGAAAAIQVYARDIFNFTTYKCSVFVQSTGSYLGTALIKIVNSLVDENRYFIIINNGTQVFKYNTKGISPANQQLDDPIVIPALTYSVFNQKGEQVDSVILNRGVVTWKVPIENTMLKIDSSYLGEEEDGYKYLNGVETLVYSIQDNYNMRYLNNDILLTIEYNGMVLNAKTDFTFLKLGLSGTNGTDFTCRIVPNVLESFEAPLNPTVYYNGDYVSFNWMNAGREDGQWFKAELWHNGELIYRGSLSTGTSTLGKEVKITSWKILRNQYNYSLFDLSDFTVTKNNNIWSFAFTGLAMFVSDQIVEWRPADIIQVTLKYDNTTYYATLPLLFCRMWLNDNYRIRLEDNTGFKYVLYSGKGIKPDYNNNDNFKLIVELKINDEWEDISLDDGINYVWYYNGIVKRKSGLNWIDDYETVNNYGQTSGKWLLNYNNSLNHNPNEKKIRPVDNYDGECVTVGLSCLVRNNDNRIGWIHIPIHMSLNRFENSTLNGWNGNSVDLGKDNGGMIIAPQVGAGVKDSNNRFTGMFIGTAKDPDQDASSITTVDAERWKEGLDVGLFGYAAGARSVFLDAKTGKAEFGVKGAGQIILDPSSNEALIRSGNYDPTTNKTGMQINLSEPSINYGSGNFSVDRDGILTAKSATLTGIHLSADESSTYGGKTMSQILALVDGNLENYKAYVSGIVSNLQDQIDDNITSWYYDYDPTLNNVPAVEWDPDGTGPDSYSAHQGDIFFNKTSSRAFRFLLDNGTWGWALIQDEDISKAIADAARAQDTANHKRRVFVQQPTPPYDPGDLWVNATYGTTYDNDLLRCKTQKSNTQSFNISDWLKAAKYTDNSELWAWVEGDYAEAYKAQLDAKIETFYQSSNPASSWTTSDLKSVHTGDIWYCTDKNNDTYGQLSWRWNGTTWEKLTTAPPDAIMDTIDGKAQVFTGSSTPTPPYSIGDLWFNGTSDNSGLIYTCVTSRSTGVGQTGDWKIRNKYTDDTALNAFKNGAYATFVTQTGNALNGKVTTFYQDNEPTAVVVGDLWIDTNDGKKLYRWNGSSWVNIQDAQIQDALAAAGTAQSTADSKIMTYAQADAPSGDLDVGDLWIETDNQNKMYRWSGSYWVAYTDTSGLLSWITNTYSTDKSSLQSQIDGKIETFSQTSDPSTAWNTLDLKTKHTGDLWYNSTSNVQKYYRWTNNGNEQFSWVEITATPPAAITTTINGKANIFTGATTPTNPKLGDLWFKGSDQPILTYINNQWVEYNKYVDQAAINSSINTYDTALTQLKVFNRLTNNGATQGIYMDDSLTAGLLYINASYIKSGYIEADRIAGGTITGTMIDANTLSTVGLSKFNNDLNLSNTYALRNESIALQQTIYITKPSGTIASQVTKPTTWVIETNKASNNTWIINIPDYNESYPRIFYATQYKLVNGTIGCTDPQINDSVTYIDGGSIRTGKIDADRIYVTELKTLGATIGGFTIDDNAIRSGASSSTSNGAIAISNVGFTRYINNISRDNLLLAIGSKFGVANDGTVYASGFVAPGDLSTAGGTVINGANITTGSITIGQIASLEDDLEDLSDDVSGAVSTASSASDTASSAYSIASSASSAASDAAKVATNYITANSSGLKLVNTYNTYNYLYINADGVYLYKKDGNNSSSIQVAQFGDTTIIGKTIKDNTYFKITSSALDMEHKDSNNNIINMAHIGYEYGASSPTSGDFAPYYTFGVRASVATVGNYSFLEGRNNAASGYCSHAEGGDNSASNMFSHVEGYYNTSSGYASHVLGGTNQAIADWSHAEGNDTSAQGTWSHAEGRSTIALHECSHAGGYYTKTSAKYQTVIGKCNADDTDALFIIGNGTGNYSRSNAFTVYSSGNAYMNGNLIATQTWANNTFLKLHQSLAGYAKYTSTSLANLSGCVQIGGILIQWGVTSNIKIANGNSKTETITFTKTFGSKPSVTISGIIANTSGLVGNLNTHVKDVSKTSFTAVNSNGNTSAGTEFDTYAYWIAIGAA